MSLEGKNLVIIGGTSGIGLSAGKAFVKAGALVVAVGLDKDHFQEAEQIYDGNGLVIQGDARLEKTSKTAIRECTHLYGRVDGLLHVAGGSGRKWGDGPLHELTLEGWNKTMELNMTSVMLSNRAVINAFLIQKTGGSIVNIGSVLGSSPAPKFFHTHAYASAKSALNGFSKSVAAFYAPYNIRVNVVSPALVDTPMSKRAQDNEAIMDFIKTKQPLDHGRIGKPGDLDTLISFLLSDDASFITGQVIHVDGGWEISDGQYQ
jgi:NAD(P)-dependent dehydrogenase (short-subunit alcohol dehydrogenase family)